MTKRNTIQRSLVFEAVNRLQCHATADEIYEDIVREHPHISRATVYRNLNMLDRYFIVTKQAYRYCCTRATMARYYRNMGFYYTSKYKPEVARACYIYSNIYYKTENADNELKFLEEALHDKTPDLSIAEMQDIFNQEGIEPGPSSDTIGVIYRVGELMMEDKEYTLARDCFAIVYDITREKELEPVLDELEKAINQGNTLSGEE